MNLFWSKRNKDPVPDRNAAGQAAASDSADRPAASPTAQPPGEHRVYARVLSECHISFQDKGANGRLNGSKIEAMTYDVSGGGVLVLSCHLDHSIQGHYLDLVLSLPKTEPIHARGIVLRDKSHGATRDRTEIAIEFSEIREQDRNTILRYVYARQSERRRLGLL